MGYVQNIDYKWDSLSGWAQNRFRGYLLEQNQIEQNQSRCTLPHARKNKDEIQGSFPFAALEGQDDDFKR